MKTLRFAAAVVLGVVLLSPARAPAGPSRSRWTPSTARYVVIPFAGNVAASGSRLGFTVWPHDSRARLVDVIVHQYTAGTIGTSWSAQVRRADGASFANMLSTASVLTLASGAYAETDAQGDIALPAGCTRPVIDSSVEVSKGSYIDVITNETGSYTVHASGSVILVFEPIQ
jgi:hypothetical protein